MGVPVVTCAGQTIAARSTAAILSALQLDRFVAADLDAYVDLAVALAGDLEALSALRAELRERLLSSPIANGAYVDAVESAYRTMWREWCANSATAARNADWRDFPAPAMAGERSVGLTV
jgi:predicted O-linked N-acetylglucosamine transferase (SPINDLY family)